MKSGLPEGIYAYSQYLASLGLHDEAQRFFERARRMGLGDGRRLAELAKYPLFPLQNDWERRDRESERERSGL